MEISQISTYNRLKLNQSIRLHRMHDAHFYSVLKLYRRLKEKAPQAPGLTIE